MKKVLFFCISIVAMCTIIHAQEVVTLTDDFESGNAALWMPKNPELWKVVNDNGNMVLQLLRPGEIPSDVRRPGAYVVLREKEFTDVSISLDVRCEAPETRKGRDFILIIGFQDEYHFYYVHFSNYSDAVHNTILIVNGTERTALKTSYRIPKNIDRQFHRIRIYRNIESGLIAAYFNDMEFPVMSAVDTTFHWGSVGFGSFDDTGSFDNIRIAGILR